MLITFEGIDGSGKTTQISLLREKIEAFGRIVRVFREPGGTAVSEKIRLMLLDPEMDINPVSELLLFSAARSQLIASTVKPLLEQGAVVILDRFYDSTVAYQGYGRGAVALETLDRINTIASHGLEPDLTFYLKISRDTSKKRMQLDVSDRMEQSGDIFYQRVINGFDVLAAQLKRFRTVDAELDVALIHDQIWAQAREYLSR
ncbi:MAG: dTMP kinase Tmk [Bacteroidetes bacterium HLUCCA01]|nr:MAG: dTMP kinase Tmk [Bacteroidetes bacterium HLUCCA01]